MNGEALIKEICWLPSAYSLGVANHYFDYIAKSPPPRLYLNSEKIRVWIGRSFHFG